MMMQPDGAAMGCMSFTWVAPMDTMVDYVTQWPLPSVSSPVPQPPRPVMVRPPQFQWPSAKDYDTELLDILRRLVFLKQGEVELDYLDNFKSVCFASYSGDGTCT